MQIMAKFFKGQIPHNKGKNRNNYLPQEKTSNKKERKDINEKKEYILDSYINKKKCQFEIANELNCDFVVINRILKENNIILRPQKDYMKNRISPMKNKHHSKEAIEKIKERRKNQIFSQEDNNRRILSRKNNGKSWFSEEALEKRSGTNHWNWLGGKSFEPYDGRFNRLFKRRIRKRDNYICMLCQKHQEKLSLPLNVHHINYDKKLTIPQNCISLCHNCHLTTNNNREHWTKFFQSLLNQKYNYQYNELNEMVIKI